MVTPWLERLSPLRRISFDTNALIYALEGRAPYGGYVNQALEKVDRGEARGFISTIVEMELLVKPLRDRNLRGLERVEIFLREMPNLVVRSADRVIAQTVCAPANRLSLRLRNIGNAHRIFLKHLPAFFTTWLAPIVNLPVGFNNNLIA